jgi:hypothetical protein
MSEEEIIGYWSWDCCKSCGTGWRLKYVKSTWYRKDCPSFGYCPRCNGIRMMTTYMEIGNSVPIIEEEI